MSQKNKGRLSRMGLAAANILRGAVTGGLHGAAIKAAESLAPTLLKWIAGILCLLLLLPTLIYITIPHFLFGYPSAGDAQVLSMTAKAQQLDAAYQSLSGISQQEMEKLAAELIRGYDSHEVNLHDGNTNLYWFIAILAVRYKQDVHAINDLQIRMLSRDKLEYSLTVEPYTVICDAGGENEREETYYRAVVDIWDMDPQQLMDRLGFTGQQKDWAAVLYGNISESQVADPDNPLYPGPGIDYGDLAFSDGARDVVYYNQTDSRWGGEMYGKTYSIAVAGCGPTALAMVVSTLTGVEVNPLEMADWAYENGYCAEGNGSYHALIPEGAEHFGLDVEGAGVEDAQQLADALSGGKLAVAIMGPGHFTTCGHFIVLRGITAEGKVLVADPVSVNKSGKEWDMQIILNEASRRAAAGGPFWIIS